MHRIVVGGYELLYGSHKRIQGAREPLAPKIFLKSCSFQVILREKPLF